MGLFRNKRPSPEPGGRPRQYPDEIAERAAERYGAHDFLGAAELYGTAIDKLHTMYVVANGALRRPGAHDQYILDGFTSALGASRAQAPGSALQSSVETPANYLTEIASIAGGEARRYLAARDEAVRIARS